MGDVARCSLGKPGSFYTEELLFRLFGVNAELLIDHAWGYEPCTIREIKAYRPESNSIGSGQVLQYPYTFEKAKLVVKEMTDLLVLDLVEKNLVTDQMVLTVGYDVESLKNGGKYNGAVTTDRYGRKIPKHAHGTANLDRQTSSTRLITEAVMELYDRIVNPSLLVRRINLTACKVVDESETAGRHGKSEQLDLFTDYEEVKRNEAEEQAALDKERAMQKTVLELRKKFGKNAVLKGMNLQEDATARERNAMIGGHKA